jgi:hypothetical protein
VTARPNVWALAADLADPVSLRWREDPVGWATERMKAELWSKQREILEAVREHPRVAVKSCHDSSKSFTAGRLVGPWWIDTHPLGDALVVSTAPTYAQVHSILWHEIRIAHQSASLAGRVLGNDTWVIPGGVEIGIGKKPANHDMSALQGRHRKYLLGLIDEAGGVPEQIWTAMETLATTDNDRILAIGNPDDGKSYFAKVCRPDSGWYVITIKAWDTPNFTGEAVSEDLKSRLISRAWVEDKRDRWKGLAIWTSKIEAEFPTEPSEWQVISYADLVKCQALEFPEGTPVEAGIDVGAGNDRTVIRERRGNRAGRERTFVDPDPMRTVGNLVDSINEWGVTKVKIDVIGIGWGVYGRLRELSSRHAPNGECTHHAEVVPVNVAEKPSLGKEAQFLNKRAEIWWDVGRENTRLHLWDLTDVDDDVLAELTSARYENTSSKGQKKIEAKAEIRKRLGVSPDRGEALLLAFWDPVAVAVIPDTRQLVEADLLRGLSPGDMSVGVWG